VIQQVRRGVALQVAIERQTLKPGFSLDRLYVTGLKGYRLWVMGQLDSNVQRPAADGRCSGFFCKHLAIKSVRDAEHPSSAWRYKLNLKKQRLETGFPHDKLKG
jgi:hypothetical protein